MSSSRTRLNPLVSFPSFFFPDSRRGIGFSGVGLVSTTRGGLRTWALDVPDDGAGRVVHELDADLGDTSTRTYFNPSASVPPLPKVPLSPYPSSPIPAQIAPQYQTHHLAGGETISVPVRPRTRVTLTSLTGVLEASILGG